MYLAITHTRGRLHEVCRHFDRDCAWGKAFWSSNLNNQELNDLRVVTFREARNLGAYTQEDADREKAQPCS